MHHEFTFFKLQGVLLSPVFTVDLLGVFFQTIEFIPLPG